MTIEEKIKQKARKLGFNLVGITDSGKISQSDIDRYENWLDAGCAADMGYLHRNFDKRVEPSLLLTDAKSVISLGMAYSHAPENHNTKDDYLGKVADYALHDDYHTVIKSKLFELADYIKQTVDNDGIKFKACVDSVPIAERSVACKAGLGFIGKNTMLINPDYGSRFFLAELITTIKLDCDTEMENTNCKNCDLCIKACPTGALSHDGRIDARKCISYHTIENKGEIPAEIADKITNNLYGCDRCVSACPYNSKTQKECVDLNYSPERKYLDLNEVLAWNKQDFKNMFAKTAVYRLGLDNFKRNAKICLNNQKND